MKKHKKYILIIGAVLLISALTAAAAGTWSALSQPTPQEPGTQLTAQGSVNVSGETDPIYLYLAANYSGDALYQKVDEYATMKMVYQPKNEEIQAMAEQLEQGKPISAVLDAYEFWTTTNSEFSLVGQLTAAYLPEFETVPFWTENVYDSITGTAGLSTEEVKEYLKEDELEQDDIAIANELSRKNVYTIKEILTKRKQGQNWYDITADIYSRLGMPFSVSMDKLTSYRAIEHGRDILQAVFLSSRSDKNLEQWLDYAAEGTLRDVSADYKNALVAEELRRLKERGLFARSGEDAESQERRDAYMEQGVSRDQVQQPQQEEYGSGFGAMGVQASTSSSLSDFSYMDIHKDTFGTQYSAPYSDKDRSSETVNSSSGELSMEQVDLTLPGKNGMDVVISRSYSNQETATTYQIASGESQSCPLGKTYLYRAPNGAVFPILFASEEEMLHFAPESFEAAENLSSQKKTDKYGNAYYRYNGIASGTTTYTREKNTQAQTIYSTAGAEITQSKGNQLGYEIGMNWRLNLPDIMTTNDNSVGSEIHRYYQTIRDYRGNVYSLISEKLRGAGSTWGPGDLWMMSYSDQQSGLSGEYVSLDGTVVDGVNCTKIITDADGNKQYFLQDQIQAVEDKYGNRITYTYGTDETGEKHITITDTMGRNITIRFQGERVTAVEYPEPGTNEPRRITYTCTAQNNSQLDPGNLLTVDDQYKLEVKDAEGNITSYQGIKTQSIYNEADSRTGTGFFVESTSNTSVRAQDAYNISQITYPTGAQTVYEYQRFYYPMGRVFSHRTRNIVTARRDVADGKTYHEYTYTYNNPKDGYSSTALADSYTYTGTTVRTADGYTTVNTFDKKGQRIKVEYQVDGVPERSTEYTYDKWTKAVSKQVEKRGAWQQTKEFTYAAGNKPTKTKEGDYEVDMTYNEYGILLTKTYKQDAATTILTENTPTADGKSIAASVVKVNGVVQSKTNYTYDQYGNVTAKQLWEADTNGDGILDDSDATVTLKTDYTYHTDHTWTQYTYVENVSDADGNTTAEIGYTIDYDALGNISSMTDPNGIKTTYSYDVMNRPTQAAFADGTTRQLSYNIPLNEVTFTDENGTQTKSQFDPLGQIERILLNDAGWKTLEAYEFNTIGQQTKKTTMRDDASSTSEETTYNPDGTVTTVRIKNAAGDIVTGTDYAYTFTATGKTVSAQVLNDPVTKVETYDLRDRKVKEEAQTAGKTHTATYIYDYLTNVISFKDARANTNSGWGNTMETTYDYAGNVLTQKNALGNTLSNTYNFMGQLVSSTDYKGNATTYVYDKMGRNIQISSPFDGTNVSKKFSVYDKNGNVIREKQQNNAPGAGEIYRIVEYEYNSKNKPIAVKQFDGATEYKTAYTYDNAGNQTSLITGANTAAPHTTAYGYNKLGQVVSETDAMGSVKTAAYDLLGNVTGGLTKAGETISNTYNDWNLPMMQSVAGTDPTTGANRTDTKSFTYDNLGRKISAMNASGTATYEYDAFGRMVKETDVTGAVKEYGYDENGNRISFKLTIGGTQQMNATYSYDKLNQLTGVTIGGDTTTYGYDANGNILNKTTGQLITEYAYNQGNLLTQMATNQQNHPVNEYSATYYLDGNRRTMWDPDEDDTVSYIYDGRGQLTREDHWFSTYYYGYDAYGNRSGRNDVADALETTYEYNANNQLLKEVEECNSFGDSYAEKTTTRYAYDANGNMVSKVAEQYKKVGGDETVRIGVLGETTPEVGSAASYSYNGFGERTGAMVDDKTAAYTYNPEGLRVSKTVNGEMTTHILDGSNVIADVKDGSITRYNRGRGLISIEQNGNKGYYAFNMHGDVYSILEGTSQLGSSRQYGAYGDLLRGSESYGHYDNPFGYLGEYTDAETGNIYLRARYYDPNTGRFTSEDPIKDGTNWYVYAGNNPMMYTDPTGKEIYLTGSREEMETQRRTMQILTADRLEVDFETGKVWISSEKSDGDRTRGTNMIRRLVAPGHKVTIRQEYGEAESNTSFTDSNGAQTLGSGSDSEIVFNNEQIVNATVRNEDGSSSLEVMPDYMILGHELVHALRGMGGYIKTDNGYYSYTSYKGNIVSDEREKREELETVGISYDYGTSTVQAWLWDTTENTLRDEQGLRRRVVYASER